MNNIKKILWFSPVPVADDPKGGSWVVSLAQELSQKENVELHVAFRSPKKQVVSSRVNEITTWHIPSDEHSKTMVNLRYLFNFKINKNIDVHLQNIIKSVNPDIIQVFGTESVLARAIIGTDIPSVIHIQCIYHIYHHKFFSGISADDVRKYSSIKSKLFKRTMIDVYKMKKEVLEREKLFYSECRNFLGRTDWDRRCSRILAPDSSYYHCDEVLRPSFFDEEWFKEKENGKLTIVSLVSGMIYKGLETVIEAYNLLSNSMKIDIVWNVIGLTQDQEPVTICRRKYGKLFEGINLLGKLSGDEIINTMKSSDVFVHPSHIENSPNSVCEAMLLGMPVIATDTGGTSSLIQNDLTGILIQDGDPWSMAGAIKELYDDHEKAAAIGKKAREIAKLRHDPKKIAADLMNIYEKIVSDRK